jgi:hypothetical protein
MEEFTIIESLMISRSGLFSDDRGMNVEFRTLEIYGIFAVIIKVNINDVEMFCSLLHLWSSKLSKCTVSCRKWKSTREPRKPRAAYITYLRLTLVLLIEGEFLPRLTTGRRATSGWLK